MGRCHRRARAFVFPLHPGSAVVALLFLLAASGVAAAAEDAAPPLRRFGFGWDPAETGYGLTVRYRLTPRWELGVAAGPADYRQDSVGWSWDDDEITIDDGQPSFNDNRREQGWVRLAAGGNFWREGRLAVSGVGAVTYRWSAEEYRDRDYRAYSGVAWDYNNRRSAYDYDTWSVALGIRPSYRVSARMQVEFEAGLQFDRETVQIETIRWWDNTSGTVITKETRHERMFRTYGGFEFSRLKFIFWF